MSKKKSEYRAHFLADFAQPMLSHQIEREGDHGLNVQDPGFINSNRWDFDFIGNPQRV